MQDTTIKSTRNATTQLTAAQLERSAELEGKMEAAHRLCHALHGTRIRALSHLARRAAQALLPSLDDRLLTPTIYGFKLCVSKQSGNNYYYQGFYEPGTLAVMARFLAPGDVFVDAGASVGLMSLRASQLVGETGNVLSFEPHPGRHKELLSSVAANAAKNVECIEAGLGDVPMQTALYSDRVSPSMVAAAEGGGESTPAHVVRLDDVLEARGIDRVKMIKIDVEGFELKVLKGASKLLHGDAPPILCVEHGVYGEEPFLPFIQALQRYRMYQLRETKAYDSQLVEVEDPSKLRRHDNVFCIPEPR